MQICLDAFRIQDESGEQYRLKELGDWAILAFKIGYETFRYDENENRLVTIVSVPSREIFTAFVVLGALVADGESFSGDGMLTWEQLRKLDDHQLVYFSDRGKITSGYLHKFSDEFQARTIRDARSALHYVTESNLRNYQIRFESPRSKGNSEVEQLHLLSAFNSSFELNVRKDWLRTLYPSISLNIVKHIFTKAIANVSCVLDDGNISLGEFLLLTEVNRMGSGKVLVKSERNPNSVSDPKIAILSTGSYERIAREYPHSDLVIILEHHEYDESIAKTARSLRQQGKDSEITRNFSQTASGSMRVISKVMRRVI